MAPERRPDRSLKFVLKIKGPVRVSGETQTPLETRNDVARVHDARTEGRLASSQLLACLLVKLHACRAINVHLLMISWRHLMED